MAVQFPLWLRCPVVEAREMVRDCLQISAFGKTTKVLMEVLLLLQGIIKKGEGTGHVGKILLEKLIFICLPPSAQEAAQGWMGFNINV